MTLSTDFAATTPTAASRTIARWSQMKVRSINRPMDRKKITSRTLWIGSTTGMTRLRRVELPMQMPARNAP